MPYAPVHGGSITRASVGNAVAAACRALQAKLVELASAAASGPFTGPSSDGIEARDGGIGRKGAPYRSEEHTSELQSLMRISYAVFCLKKKKHKRKKQTKIVKTNHNVSKYRQQHQSKNDITETHNKQPVTSALRQSK